MSQVLGKLLVITACMSLAACTSLRPVTDWQSPVTTITPASGKGLKPGDQITVTTAAGLKAEMEFVTVTADAIEGVVGKDRKVVQIPRDQIHLVERQEVDALKTTGAVGAVVLGTFVTLLGSVTFMPY
jgi:hypothetical protein